MTITKFTHACLLVETPDRTVLFDPGVMSLPLLEQHQFGRLDDIIITHQHNDHMAIDYIKQLVEQFPAVRLTAPTDAVDQLHAAGLARATDHVPAGLVTFTAPHAPLAPFGPQPQEYGYHYLGQLTHPGDSHSFNETSPILALPVTAPWGSTVRAVNLALTLKPQFVIPIHDWHWRDEARLGQYKRLTEIFNEAGITFISAVDGEPFTIDI